MKNSRTHRYRKMTTFTYSPTGCSFEFFRIHSLASEMNVSVIGEQVQRMGGSEATN